MDTNVKTILSKILYISTTLSLIRCSGILIFLYKKLNSFSTLRFILIQKINKQLSNQAAQFREYCQLFVCLYLCVSVILFVNGFLSCIIISKVAILILWLLYNPFITCNLVLIKNIYFDLVLKSF